MTYIIECIGYADAQGHIIDAPLGYQAMDYLEGFTRQEFDTQAKAAAWIAAHHKGPDVDGISAVFAPAELLDANA